LLAWIAAASCGVLTMPAASAHDAQIPIAADKIVLKVDGAAAGRKLVFKASDPSISTVVSPTAGFSLLVSAEAGGRTALVRLDPALWKASKSGAVYKYNDKAGTRGGVRKIVLKPGKILIKARGAALAWAGGTAREAVWVLFRIEQEWHCARMSGSGPGDGGGGGVYKARAAAPLGGCPEPLCGNGVVEGGEACDDTDLDDVDGCTHACAIGPCEGQSFDSTLAAIQTVIFDNPAYGCTNGACHDAVDPAGALDLTSGRAYDSLLGAIGAGAPATNAVGEGVKRVEPSEPLESFLYHKLARRTLGESATFAYIPGGSAMPSSGPPLAEAHLQALYDWIRGGAPRDTVVLGTAGLLGTCLGEPQPLTVIPPPHPGGDVGIQLQQTPWPLPRSSEDEICMATYYDVSAIVPEWAKIPCPPAFSHRAACAGSATQIPCDEEADCGSGGRCLVVKNATNPASECFAWRRQLLVQDPQSHHSILNMYTGGATLADPGWGPWTYKSTDSSDPRNGTACDPAAVDPTLGYNPGCSGGVVSAAACLGYGPADFSNFTNDPGALTGESGNAPQFSGSQEPYFDQDLAEGVYTLLPIRGIVVWNSHAFNLTNFDSTMSQYLNVYFAPREQQIHQGRLIFDSRAIFVQDVPAFDRREYCKTYTLPRGARLFQLSSHTHRFGTLFRIWAPPNTPCTPRCPGGFASDVGCERNNRLPFCEDVLAAAPPDPARLAYRSTAYSDPLQLEYRTPIPYDDADPASRTYLYCGVFDNGAGPESPSVKRQSMAPAPPPVFGLPLAPGGPCTDQEVSCLGGSNKGQPCGGDDAACPGSVCDACPVRGGVTTEDEMFIMLGLYYVVP
jgi:cysteine-rich repeat protein